MDKRLDTWFHVGSVVTPFRTRVHAADSSLASPKYEGMAKAVGGSVGRPSCFVGKDAFTQDIIIKDRSWAMVAVKVHPYVPVVLEVHGRSQAGIVSSGPIVLSPEFALKPKSSDPEANKRATRAAQALSLKLIEAFDAVECFFEIGAELVVMRLHLETL